VGLVYGASQAGPARGSRPTWPFGPRPRSRGACSHGAGPRRPGQIQPIDGEMSSGWESQSTSVRGGAHLGAAERRGLTGEVVSTEARLGEGGTTVELADEGSPAVVDGLGSLHGPARSLWKRRCGWRTTDNSSQR
jgi:hypothetical protein